MLSFHVFTSSSPSLWSSGGPCPFNLATNFWRSTILATQKHPQTHSTQSLAHTFRHHGGGGARHSATPCLAPGPASRCFLLRYLLSFHISCRPLRLSPFVTHLSKKHPGGAVPASLCVSLSSRGSRNTFAEQPTLWVYSLPTTHYPPPQKWYAPRTGSAGPTSHDP